MLSQINGIQIKYSQFYDNEAAIGGAIRFQGIVNETIDFLKIFEINKF